MKYRSDIDGLRAIAVLAVILFHAHVPGFSGGFVGVDIFFVISGYLICSIIVAELQGGRFSIVRFYERRCRRILPALFVMFAVVTVLATFVMLPPDMTRFCSSLLSATLFASNIYFWRVSSNYFEGASHFKPLLHTWSLGVEEQFYIFIPLLLIFISRRLKSRYPAWLLPLSACSLALSVWGVANAPTATFYSLPTRFWELATGAMVGVGMSNHRLPRVAREMIGGGGMLLCFYSISMLSESSAFPGLNALIPCLGAAALLYQSSVGSSFVSSLLGTRPLVFVGQISYSLYLWHWPLLSLAKYQAIRELTHLETAAILAAAFLLAAASWRYVEMPVRRGAHSFGAPRVLFGSVAAMFLVSSIAFTGIATHGFGFRFPNYVRQDIPGRLNFSNCFLSENQTPKSWRGEDCFLTKERGPIVLLWGDSYAAQYAAGITDQEQSITVDYLQYTASACPPVFDYYTAGRPNCRAFNDNVPNILAKYKITAVVMAGRWETFFERGVTPKAVAATANRLISMGVRVSVIGQSPVFYNDVQTIFAQSGGGAPEASAPLSFERSVNDKLASVLPVGTFIDPLSFMCGPTVCDYRKDGQFLTVDSGHFSVYGSNLAVARYFPYFSRTRDAYTRSLGGDGRASP
jgi:peptidoglycan/LPS O-acetylase OafA/YrhL